MKRIPEEHVGARELERQLRRLGEEARGTAGAAVPASPRGSGARRRRRWTGGRGALGVAIGIGIGLAGAAGATKVIFSDNGATVGSEKRPGAGVQRVPAA